jgi:hypothetical protein
VTRKTSRHIACFAILRNRKECYPPSLQEWRPAAVLLRFMALRARQTAQSAEKATSSKRTVSRFRKPRERGQAMPAADCGAENRMKTTGLCADQANNLSYEKIANLTRRRRRKPR